MLSTPLQTTGSDLKVLCHADLETKNILWQNGNQNLLAIIDWQTAHAGNLVTDLALLMGLNLDVEDRRQSELMLIRLFVEKWNRMNVESKKLSLVEVSLFE